LIGLVAIIYVLHSFATGPFASSTYLEALTMISIVMWVVLIFLSISLFLSRRKYSEKKMLFEVKKAVSVHRWVLAPSSLLFLLATLLSAPFFLL